MHLSYLGQRVHWNQNTAYHDLSLVYGSTEEQAEELRSKHRGMYLIQHNENNKIQQNENKIKIK